MVPINQRQQVARIVDGTYGNVDDLYNACIIQQSSIIRWASVQSAVVNQSAAETLIWSAILMKQRQDVVNSTKLSLDQICYLFAILTTWEYREGGAIAALQFVMNDSSNKQAWEVCCESVFSIRQLKSHGGSSGSCIHTVWSIQAHFLTICWAASQMRNFNNLVNTDDDWFRSPLLTHITGFNLWNSMPERYRELEIRKQPVSIQQEWNDFIKETSKNEKGSNEHEPIFIVNMIQHFLHLIEGESLKLGHHNSWNAPSNKKRLFVEISSEAGRSDDVDDEENMETSDYDIDSGSEKGDKDDNILDDSIDPVREDVKNDEIEQENEIKTKSAESLLLTEWKFVHRALELLIDLLSSSTADVRRYLVPYLLSIHWTVRCQQAMGNSMFSNANEHLLLTQQLLERIVRWIHFPVKVMKSESKKKQAQLKPIDSVEMRSMFYQRASIVQKICFRYFSEQLPDVIYAGVGLLCNSSFLRQQAFQVLDDNKFAELLHKLRLIDSHQSGPETFNRNFLMAVLEEYLIIPVDLIEELRTFPLYPTENVLWNFSLIPPSHSSLLPSQVLSLPKLQTKFLSFADYLWRNFELVRLESAYEIRSDICDAVRRLRPVARQVVNGNHGSTYYKDPSAVTELRTEFSGWSRMAIELNSPVELKRVNKPLLGEKYPASVLAEFSIDLAPCGDRIRREWDELGEHDVLFLVKVDATEMSGRPAPLLSDYKQQTGQRQRLKSNRRLPDEDDRTFPSRFGVQLVRGCKIVHVRDDAGTILSDPSVAVPAVGTKRIYLVELDPTQYALDSKSSSGTDLYQRLNLVIRRHGKTNNFRSVLETVRGLLIGLGSIGRVIPSWLQSVLLGQGDPKEASYKSETVKSYATKTAGVAKPNAFLDYGDTFLNEEHLRSCFKFNESVIIRVDGREEMENSDQKDVVRSNYRVRVLRHDDGNPAIVEAVSYPYGREATGNLVRFTPLQVEAITSGLSPGLTLVVGPPGTGKSDTAVQIIASLYHSFPTQRTVVIAHSNAALNDIFQKVMARGDIQERYLVRLGVGERHLQTDSTHDFTKAGRVAFSLERRRGLLNKVQRLAESLGLSTPAERGQDGSSAYTCETADFFNRHQIRKRILIFERLSKEQGSQSKDADVTALFPFAGYFGIGEQKVSYSVAHGHFSSLNDMFMELAEYRPFELLRSHRQRSDYLIMKQAKVVAMTCTHAAIARTHLIELGFEYDNIIMEEAGQMLEIETFVPLLLQRGEADNDTNSSSSTRLKRLCLMGDHNQLPPVIQNMSFAKYSNLDQSLFTRLIRSGVPFIQLDKQGRARSEIANLYSWRYDNLGSLDHVYKSTEFSLANPGLAHVFQLINVENYDGRGESSPTPYFYQNMGEAEYVVALFQYLVMIGYPPKKISILTTYNGQKDLISDVLSHRCGEGTPLAGVRPFAVSTVDQYQGQQNDIILVSLVRTETVGHLRDVRRLIVAVSRARLGLYIFCRQDLFCMCHELKPTMNQFLSGNKPTKLQLVIGESYPTDRKVSDEIPADSQYEVDDVVHMGNLVHKMQEEMILAET